MATSKTSYDSLPGAHGLHKRDGSLLRKKQEQWQKERSESATWFPFGSPGGGAPNRKTPKNTPNSINSPDVHVPTNHFLPQTSLTTTFPATNDDLTSSEHIIENPHSLSYSVITSSPYLNPVPIIYPDPSQTPHLQQPPYYIVTSTNNTQTPPFNSRILLQQTPPMISGMPPTPIPLLPASSMPSTSASFVSPTYLPAVQSPTESVKQGSFVFANTVYGHPIPVELIQGPNGQMIPKFPYTIPVQQINSSSINQLPTDPHHNITPFTNKDYGNMSTTYTEQWANQLPLWGKENSFEIGKSSLPPINMNQSFNSYAENTGLTMNNENASKKSSMSDLTRVQQIHDSMSSLNSPTNKNIFGNEKDRRKREAIEIQMAIDEQIAEKRRLEILQAEKERKETEKIAQEHMEREQMRKKEAEHEQNRWKEKQTEVDAREKAMLEKLEEAKREAEAFKKARLYKHVLEAADSPQEVAQKILGTHDAKEAQKVLKQVDDLTYQKRMEMEQLYTSPPASSRNDNKKPASSGSSAPSSSRANSLPPKSQLTKSQEDSQVVDNEMATPITRNARGRQSLRISPSKKVLPPRRAESNERPIIEKNEASTKNFPLQKSLSRERRSSQNLPGSQIPRLATTQTTQKPIKYPDERPLPTMAKQQNSNGFAGDYPGEQVHENPTPASRGVQRSTSVDKAVNTSFENHHIEVPMDNQMYRGCTQNALKLIADLPNDNVIGLLSYQDAFKIPKRKDAFVKPIGLFEPVQTRAKNMRQTSIETPIIITQEISSSPTSSSPPLSAGYESGSSPPHNSPYGGSRKNSNLAGHPHPETNGLAKNKFPYKARSNLSSNFLGSNSSIDDPASRPPASPFVRRLAETNSKKHIQDYLNSNEINNQRKISSPTMMRLQSSNMSINSLNGNEAGDNSENEHHLQSRSTTPRPFNCRTSQYRSLNLKKNKERQEEILKQLANLRMQLKDKQQQMERTWSNQSLARSATTGSMGQTLNKG